MIRRLALLLALPAVLGCGEPATEAASTPDGTLEAMRTVLEREDWGALYELTPPSERHDHEVSWDERRKGPSRDLEPLAGALGVGGGEVAGMKFLDVFVRLMEKCSRDEFPVLCFLKNAGLTAGEIEGVLCRVECGCGKCAGTLVLRRERGCWYVGGLLTKVQTVALAGR